MNYLEFIGKCVVILTILIFLYIYLTTPQIECTTYAKNLDDEWYVKYKDTYYIIDDNVIV